MTPGPTARRLIKANSLIGPGLKGGGTLWAIPLQNVRWRDVVKRHTATHSISYAFAIAVRSAFDPRCVGPAYRVRPIGMITHQGSKPEQLLLRLILRSLKGLVDDPAQVRAITIN